MAVVRCLQSVGAVISECDIYRKKNWTAIPGEEQDEQRPELGKGNWG